MKLIAFRAAALVGLVSLATGALLWSAPASATPPATVGASPHGQAKLGFTGLSAPRGLSIDAAGNAYVADTGNNRVVKLSAGDRVQTTVGFTGLSHPQDVAVDAAGNVYASDSGNSRVVKLPAGGGPQVTLPFVGLTAPDGIAVDGAGAVYAVQPVVLGASPPYVGRVLKLAGSTQVELAVGLRSPAGMDVGSDGTVYVAETYFNRIRVIPPSGPLGSIESSNFSTPVDVAVNSTGALYVASKFNNQIVQIPVGGGNGTVVPFRNLSNPLGVAVQGTTDVWASDTLHDRVVQLHGPGAELRVTTSPPVGGDIIVDGIARDAWGLNWVRIPEGDHQVCFGRVVGYTTPACQDVSLTTAAATTVVGAYQQMGSIRVLTDPPVDAMISVTVGDSDWITPRNNWGLWTDLQPESYTVCFGPVKGYDVPACRLVQITAGATTTTTGTFTPNPDAEGPPASTGHLRATTDPPLPAEVSIAGQVRNTWGLDWLAVPFMGSDLCFGEVPGYTGPAVPCTSFSQQPGETTTFVGHYQPKGYLRVITDPAVPGTVSIDGVPSDAYGVWLAIAPGPHDVCFGDVPGYVAPPCQDGVVVNASATTTVTGSYLVN